MAPAATIPDTNVVSLASLRQGQTAIIAETRLDADDAALLLKAMGLCTAAAIKIVRSGHPCVVAVGGTGGLHSDSLLRRHLPHGLAKGLAEQIFVTAVA